MPLTADHFEMGLKKLNADFQWNDYDASQIVVTEWPHHDGSFQGMKMKSLDEP